MTLKLSRVGFIPGILRSNQCHDYKCYGLNTTINRTAIDPWCGN